MNKIALLLIVSIGFTRLLFGQESTYNSITSIGLTMDGAVPKVIPVENKSAHELYVKAKEWVAKNYESSALIYDSTDYRIKVSGFKDVAFKVSDGRDLYDMDYTLVLSFKDNKYRFEFELNTFYFNPRNTKYRSEGEKQPTGWDQSYFYEQKFELKPKYSYCYTTLTETMSAISESLYQSIIASPSEKKEEDDW